MILRHGVLLLLLAAACCAVAAAPGASNAMVRWDPPGVATQAAHHWDSGLGPRLQWEANDGYCGEVSTVMALLRFGGYVSQYDVRAIATSGGNQSTDYYLVGENDEATAAKLRLAHIEYPNTCSSTRPRHCSMQYLAWVKKMVKRGHAVTITVYMNSFLFFNTSAPHAGEPDYDHIVSVLSVESAYDDDEYHDTDILTLDDHGLWAPQCCAQQCPAPRCCAQQCPAPQCAQAQFHPANCIPQFNFTYNFREFQASRKQANSPNGNVYYLPDRYPSDTGNFGIAHTGPLQRERKGTREVADATLQLLPVRVDTSVNWEQPAIVDGSSERPPFMPLTLTITVSRMVANVHYSLYLFNDTNAVPVHNFNAVGRALAQRVWQIVGAQNGQHTVTLETNTAAQAIFRAVRSDAP